jgi:hypothetical protein
MVMVPLTFGQMILAAKIAANINARKRTLSVATVYASYREGRGAK